jgi:hypothetical protein
MPIAEIIECGDLIILPTSAAQDKRSYIQLFGILEISFVIQYQLTLNDFSFNMQPYRGIKRRIPPTFAASSRVGCPGGAMLRDQQIGKSAGTFRPANPFLF